MFHNTSLNPHEYKLWDESLYESQMPPPPPPPSWEEISLWLERSVDGKWRINPYSGKIDIVGNFIAGGVRIKKFPDPGFGSVTGDFLCQYLRLNSLAGSPQFVGGNFLCYENDLESLIGGPTIVGGNYICSGNPLRSLDGAPAEIGGSFDCAFFAIYKWSPESLAKTFFGKGIPFFDDSAPDLIFPLLRIQDIVNHIREFPLDVDLLDSYEETKRISLQLSGIQDFTDLARAIRMGVV